MSRRTKRWVSITVLAVLAFFQASTVFAACAMDRASLSQPLHQATEHDCCDDGAPTDGGDTMPMSANACVTHSTADLQVAGYPMSLAVAGSDAPAFSSPTPALNLAQQWGALPRGGIPPRILLHSFLI